MKYNVFQNKIPLIAVKNNKQWVLYKFDEILIDDTKNALKVKKEDYAEQGIYPIVDQGQTEIAGYRDDESGIYQTNGTIIFGDHTRIIKYINFPLFLGADGVKLLKCKQDNENIDIKYIYYFLKTIELPSDGYSRHFKYLKEVIIPVPNIAIQKKIIGILDKTQSLIDKRKEQIKACDELIKSQFIEMFGDEKNRMPLGELCTIKARIGWQGLTKKEYLYSGKYRLVTGVDFNNGKIDFEKCYYVTQERYEQDDNIKLKVGDVLVTKDGTIGKVAIVDRIDLPTTLNSGVFVVRDFTGRLNNIFLVHALLSDNFRRFIDNIKIGATIAHLNQGAFIKYEIPVPSIELQNEFAEFVQQVNQLQDQMQESLIELENNFNSLMQRAFKGELF